MRAYNTYFTILSYGKVILGKMKIFSQNDTLSDILSDLFDLALTIPY